MLAVRLYKSYHKQHFSLSWYCLGGHTAVGHDDRPLAPVLGCADGIDSRAFVRRHCGRINQLVFRCSGWKHCKTTLNYHDCLDWVFTQVHCHWHVQSGQVHSILTLYYSEIISNCCNSFFQSIHHHFWCYILHPAISSNRRDGVFDSCFGLSLDPIHNCSPMTNWTWQVIAWHHLWHCIHLLLLRLPLKRDCYTIHIL